MEPVATAQKLISESSSRLGWLLFPVFAISVLFWIYVLWIIGKFFYESVSASGPNTIPIILTIIAITVVIIPIFTLFGPILKLDTWMRYSLNVDIVNDDPDYADLVAEVNHLAKTAGLRPVRYVAIAPNEFNAFALGFFPSHMAVVIGDRLMERMSGDPTMLRAIIGHEIGHLASGDTRLSTMVLISRETLRLGFVVPVIFVMGLLGYSFAASGDAGPKHNSDEAAVSLFFQLFGLVILLFTAVLWAGAWILFSAIRALECFHSRKREFMADRAGALLTSRSKMIAALRVLGEPEEDEAKNSQDYLAALKVANQTSGSLFATHPSIKLRIARLENDELFDSSNFKGKDSH